MEERAIDRLRKFARYARDKGVVKVETHLRLIVNYQIDTFIIP